MDRECEAVEQELKAGFQKALEMLGESKRYMDSSFTATYAQIRQAWEDIGETTPDPPSCEAALMDTTILDVVS